MHNESVNCLLARLEQLNAEGPETQTAFSDLWKFLGYTNEEPPVQEQELDKSKFINIITVEEKAEIEDTKTKITACLKELEDTQAQAFVKQKEITKKLYDFLSKYNGVYNVAWVRGEWFSMTSLPHVYHFRNDEERDQYDKIEAREPADWKQKMVHKGTTPTEIKEWEDYVDANWDTAYENAFGVTAFREFITTGVPRMMNLDLNTSKSADVERIWSDLKNRTEYFHKKTSMHHLPECAYYKFKFDTYEDMRIAWAWSLPANLKISDSQYQGFADVESRKIADAFYHKTEELLALVTTLWSFRQSGWDRYYDSESGDNWVYQRGKHVQRFTQPNYVVPRPVKPYDGTRDC